jgi:hypothetical protein
MDPGGRARFGLVAVVVFVAREHHVVDDQRVLPRREQFRELDLCRFTPGLHGVEFVVLRDQTAGWERPARDGERLHLAAQRDFLLQQLVAGGTLFGGFSGKASIMRLAPLLYE